MSAGGGGPVGLSLLLNLVEVFGRNEINFHVIKYFCDAFISLWKKDLTIQSILAHDKRSICNDEFSTYWL